MFVLTPTPRVNNNMALVSNNMAAQRVLQTIKNFAPNKNKAIFTSWQMTSIQRHKAGWHQGPLHIGVTF